MVRWEGPVPCLEGLNKTPKLQWRHAVSETGTRDDRNRNEVIQPSRHLSEIQWWSWIVNKDLDGCGGLGVTMSGLQKRNCKHICRVIYLPITSFCGNWKIDVNTSFSSATARQGKKDTVPPPLVRRSCFHSISFSPLRPQPSPEQPSQPGRPGTEERRSRSPLASALYLGRPAPISHRTL
jgi:hypothetical protein